ncbi:Exocyst complex component SEC5B [Vitis vinifera]|uniref:Exocyst complex component SEC5B n=1 Tax=Vitis vinifera TaxID=29760 RepID=A0A438EMX1_VITVI|nr:Exocyst complex component SEC5B [Vitis vinifera]
MSSDSDDEEELLQMALKEQAQRDVNYNKAGRASKPVVNYVQAPPHPSTAAKQRNPNPNPNQRSPATQKGRRGGVEDEDDRSRGAGGRGEKEDGDKGWDGGEPNCWKTVDEAEGEILAALREMAELDGET